MKTVTTLCLIFLLSGHLSSHAQDKSGPTDQQLQGITKLIKEEKFSEAKTKIDVYLEVFPNDPALMRLKEQLNSLNEQPGGPSNAQRQGNDRISQNATSSLSSAAKLEINTLAEIAREAESAKTEEEGQKLLEELLQKSSAAASRYPTEIRPFLTWAAAALALDRPYDGWQAGQGLKKLGATDSSDSGIQSVMAKLNRKGWLADEFGKDAISVQKRITAEKETELERRRMMKVLGESWCQPISDSIVNHEDVARPDYAIGSGCVTFELVENAIWANFNLELSGYNIPDSARDGVIPYGSRRLKNKTSITGRGKLEFATTNQLRKTFGNCLTGDDALLNTNGLNCFVRDIVYSIEYELSNGTFERKNYEWVQMFMVGERNDAILLGVAGKQPGDGFINLRFRLEVRQAGVPLPRKTWPTKEEIARWDREAKEQMEKEQRRLKEKWKAEEDERKRKEEEEENRKLTSRKARLIEILDIVDKLPSSTNQPVEYAEILVQAKRASRANTLGDFCQILRDLYYSTSPAVTNGVHFTLLTAGLCLVPHNQYDEALAESFGWKNGQILLELNATNTYAFAEPIFSKMRSRGWFLQALPQFTATLKKAESGSALDQFEVAKSYAWGDGIKANPQLAYMWLSLSVGQKHRPAVYRLGDALREGDKNFGVQRDSGRAVAVFESLFLNSSTNDFETDQAAETLATMFENGEGVPIDRAKALKWWTKRHEADEYPFWARMYKVAELLHQTGDSVKAKEYYRKFAEIIEEYGLDSIYDAEKWIKLAELYREGRGVPKNSTKANTIYSKVASLLQDRVKASSGVERLICLDHLAVLLEKGLGVKKDEGTAFNMYQERNDTWNLARCYADGIGTKRNPEAAYTNLLNWSAGRYSQVDLEKTAEMKKRISKHLSNERIKELEEKRKNSDGGKPDA